MIEIIVAMDLNGVIGRRGSDMPWGRGLKDDLANFKALTTGHTVVMGRRTFKDDVKRPLPNRRNLILTRDRTFQAEGCEVLYDWDEIFQIANASTVFAIGGAEVYSLAHPLADRLHISRVFGHFQGNVVYPFHQSNGLWNGFKLYSTNLYQDNTRNTFQFSYEVWERIVP